MIPRYTNPEMGRLWSDETKFALWLRVELAVCEAWAEIGAVPPEALPLLQGARVAPARVVAIEKETHHEMTAFLRAAAESLGPESRFIHLGLTSSDVIDTALSLQLLEAIALVQQDLQELEKAVTARALEHKDTIMMGRTHGVHAEPITFGLKLALWVDELRRHQRRLDQAREMIAVGKLSGAVGTHATVPPEVEERACALLGLKAAPVSSQVLQRDRHAQVLTTLALLAGSLEKIALEFRGLQRTEVLEVEEPFAEGQTGSSAMPHKRNPELCERICGLARVVRGHALTALENIALWHERDISHSSTERIIFPDSFTLVDYMLRLLTGIVRGLLVYPEHMKRNVELTKGLVFSQRVLLALIEKGVGRHEAYRLVQRNAMESWQQGSDFLGLLKADPEVLRWLQPTELEALFDYGYFLRYVDTAFQRLGLLEVPSGARAG